MGEIAEPDRVEPEDIIERMVEADRNQKPVQKGIDCGARSAKPRNSLSENDESGEEHRPEESQQSGGKDRCDAGGNHGASLSAEESEPVRELCVFETVVAARTDETGKDADEGIFYFLKSEKRFRIILKGGDDRLHKIRT